jgi:heat shock protein HspQ|tara:strand:+ start:147 stop:392 length:246 start_codon:yes stop_codon:yes gene_type:complete
MPDSTSKCQFAFGQQIHHKLFDYYGVIVAVDPCYKGDDQWYEMVARSRPPKEKPWYHVKKADGSQTYVAERNLERNPVTNN